MEYNKYIQLRSFEIKKSTWKPNDLQKVCAMLNTQGGSLTLGTKVKPVDKLTNLIEKKIRRIGPSTDNLISLSTIIDEERKQYVRISIKKSDVPCYIQTVTNNKYFYYCAAPEKDVVEKAIIPNKRVARKSITRITPMMIIPDTKFVENYEFDSGNSVPIFEVFSVFGFNRIVGYLKYLNRTYANVYSRGECKLHKSLIPSLYREKTDIKNEDKKVTAIVNKFFSDPKLSTSLSLDISDKENSRHRIEGVLQHYGATTSFLDVVDNHWIALWMGLNKYEVKQQIDFYAEYKERKIPFVDKLCANSDYADEDKWEDAIYQYVLLIATPIADEHSMNGINKTKDFIEIDLRKALPSTYLRPHAQHGLVIKKNVSKGNPQKEDFDISTNVVCIVKIRIDRAKTWIGNGELLTQDNLIPPPGYDPGYDLLLSKYDIFRNSSLKITKYM
jgi:hypothetical protein